MNDVMRIAIHIDKKKTIILLTCHSFDFHDPGYVVLVVNDTL